MSIFRGAERQTVPQSLHEHILRIVKAGDVGVLHASVLFAGEHTRPCGNSFIYIFPNRQLCVRTLSQMFFDALYESVLLSLIIDTPVVKSLMIILSHLCINVNITEQ